MNSLIKLFCLPFILLSYTDNKQVHDANPKLIKTKYELVKVDSYSFRRAYHGHDTLTNEERELFMNRKPEANQAYLNSEKHPFYNELEKKGVILDGDLNIERFDTLQNQSSYLVSQPEGLTFETKLLYEPTEIDTPAYELRFKNDSGLVFTDTLKFDFPPDVTFFTEDLNNDGKQEILTLCRWYIANGDNFDLVIYELNNKR